MSIPYIIGINKGYNQWVLYMVLLEIYLACKTGRKVYIGR